LAALARAGCHSEEERRGQALPTGGPQQTLRVALDPVLGDETIRRMRGFFLQRSTRDRLVFRGPHLTVVFRRMEPHAAVQAFRRGELDEAPVPQGELRAVAADPTLSPALRARQLNGLDAIVLPRSFPPGLVRAYSLTVPRGDYQSLISERVAPPAYGLTRDAEPTSAADARRARGSLRSLPRIPITIGVRDTPELVEAAEIPWADWRQLGLPVRLVPGAQNADARFVRMIPPGTETGNVVPLGWVAEARLVSPRVHGWEMDELGMVDYSRVALSSEPGA
jgi:hypothetical protein